MLRLRTALRMNRKDDPEVLNCALSAIKNKYDDAGVFVDETDLLTTLIAAVPKEHLS